MRASGPGKVFGIAASIVLLPCVSMADVSADDEDIESRLRRLDEQVRAQAEEIRELRQLLAQAGSGPEAPESRKTPAEREFQAAVDVGAKHPERRLNQIALRGGYANGSAVFAQSGSQLRFDPDSGQVITQRFKGHDSYDTDGVYFGVTLDRSLTDDLWGHWQRLSLGAEFMVEYLKNEYSLRKSRFDSKHDTDQIMLSISPKARVNGFGRFEPWVIPFGMVFSVSSELGNPFFGGGGTNLSPGVMIGTGLDYQLWKEVHAGVDFRDVWLFGSFHQENSVNAYHQDDRLAGFQSGGYLGFRF